MSRHTFFNVFISYYTNNYCIIIINVTHYNLMYKYSQKKSTVNGGYIKIFVSN